MRGIINTEGVFFFLVVGSRNGKLHFYNKSSIKVIFSKNNNFLKFFSYITQFTPLQLFLFLTKKIKKSYVTKRIWCQPIDKVRSLQFFYTEEFMLLPVSWIRDSKAEI